MDLHEEDANISTFRRDNKIIAVGFTLLIISLTLFILVLAAVLLLPILTASISYPVVDGEISVEKFCSYSQAPMCITALNSVVTDRFATDPHQLVALCIESATAELQNLIAAASSTRTDKFACSESFGQAAELARLSLEETVRAKRPLVGWLRKERDEVVLRWLMGAEGAVDSCLRESAEVESPETSARVAAKMEYVRAYLFSAYVFLDHSGAIEQRNEGFYMDTDFENLFSIFVCGVQLFVLGFVCLLFRNRSSRVSLKQFFMFFF